MQIRLSTEPSSRRRTHRGASTASEKVEQKEKSSFLEILEEILPSRTESNRDLRALWAELPGIEKELLDYPAEERLKRYREIVRQIARETITKNTRLRTLKRKSSLTGETIELKVLDIIDDRLHRMALLMHSPDNTAFTILKTLDEIRGLLLDLRE